MKVLARRAGNKAAARVYSAAKCGEPEAYMGNTARWITLMLAGLMILMLGSCCYLGDDDFDDTQPDVHSEGGGSDT